ncbi:hypothetical protein I0C86_11770 [Plantactinospora sp. S1510]|uniref:GPI inositol-deacylase PGAP1-like alpha/beta domain-containing protein n=1 Tax=Plantactinospora alkalitolerans TaxID=2789879 RepID=A0ABS0GTV9_9ACTN|nr:hypothetical protein [Plantactinospora alkalitolerans]MBF9129635.1 hypothetical protein [Plantactinospora alkalitolerans]
MKQGWIRPTIGAVVVGVVAALSMAVPAAATPVRNDSADKPVLFIHGFDGEHVDPGYDCNSYWGAAVSAMRGWAWTGDLVTVGYYTGDTNCSLRPSRGGRFTSILDLGKQLAETIYQRYSQNGVAVDVIAHSMGGLIIRSALTGVQERRDGYPPFIFVEDVVTLSTPHGTGSALATLCGAVILVKQCVEMASPALMLSLKDNPQGTHGTDWTVVGFEGDVIVPSRVATNMNARHKVIYNDVPGTSHANIHQKTTGSWTHKYSNDHGDTWTDPSGNQAAPVRVANNGCYWYFAW